MLMMMMVMMICSGRGSHDVSQNSSNYARQTCTTQKNGVPARQRYWFSEMLQLSSAARVLVVGSMIEFIWRWGSVDVITFGDPLRARVNTAILEYR